MDSPTFSATFYSTNEQKASLITIIVHELDSFHAAIKRIFLIATEANQSMGTFT